MDEGLKFFFSKTFFLRNGNNFYLWIEKLLWDADEWSSGLVDSGSV